MIFISILIIVTIAIASAAAYFSVYGLAHLFTGAIISVIIMGSAIEAGKLVAASFLYRYWTRIGLALKAYLLSAVALLMLITSMGIFGFLTAAYQQDTIPLVEMQQKIVLLEEERKELIDRRERIDKQVEGVSANMVRSKERLAKSFQTERTSIETRLAEVTPELQKLKTEQINVEAKVGPIMFVAEVLGEDPNKAVFWFIIILISVFDPLAVALTIAVNIALRLRKEDIEKEDEARRVAAEQAREVRRKAREEAQAKRDREGLPDISNTDPTSLQAYIDKQISKVTEK